MGICRGYTMNDSNHLWKFPQTSIDIPLLNKCDQSYQNHHVNRALDVETCCEIINVNILSNCYFAKKRSQNLKEHFWI